MQAHRQIGGSSAAISTATLEAVVMPCLYTKQKTKKRKTFTDGILKVSESNGLCILYSASDTFISAKEGSLESQFISPQEAKKVLQGEYAEIEFESYFVTVERIIQASTVNAALKPAAVSFKIPRFKPPSYTPSVKPIEREIAVTEKQNESMIMKTNKRNMYNVGVSELEELWGEDDEEGDDEKNDGKKDQAVEEEEREGLRSHNNSGENLKSTNEWNGKNNHSEGNHNSAHNNNNNESKPHNAWDGLDDRSDNSVNQTFPSRSDNRNYQNNENTRKSVYLEESRKGNATHGKDDNYRNGQKHGNDNNHGYTDGGRDRDRDRDGGMHKMNDDVSGGGKSDFDIWGGDSSVWGTVPSPPPPLSSSSRPPSSPSSSFPSSSSSSSSYPSSSSSTRPPPSKPTPSHERGPNLENAWGTSARNRSNDDYGYGNIGVSKERNNSSNQNYDGNGDRNYDDKRNDNSNDYNDNSIRHKRIDGTIDSRHNNRTNDGNDYNDSDGNKLDGNHMEGNRNNYDDDNNDDYKNRDDSGNRNGDRKDNRNKSKSNNDYNNDTNDDDNRNDNDYDRDNVFGVQDSSRYFNSFADQIIYNDINTSYQNKIEKKRSETNEHEINHDKTDNGNVNVNGGYGTSKNYHDEVDNIKNENYGDDNNDNSNDNYDDYNDVNDGNHDDENNSGDENDHSNHNGNNVNIACDITKGNEKGSSDRNARTTSPTRSCTPPSHTPDTPPLSPSLFYSTSTPDNTTFTLPSLPPSTHTLLIVPKIIKNVLEHSVSAERSGNINAQEEKNIWDF